MGFAGYYAYFTGIMRFWSSRIRNYFRLKGELKDERENRDVVDVLHYTVITCVFGEQSNYFMMCQERLLNCCSRSLETLD